MKSIKKQIYTMPCLKAAHKANHKPVAKLEAITNRVSVHVWAKQVSVDGIRQDVDTFRGYSRVHHTLAQRSGDRDHHVGFPPHAVFYPLRPARERQTRTVDLFFVGQWSIDLKDLGERAPACDLRACDGP
jgi:hypothetical protein